MQRLVLLSLVCITITFVSCNDEVWGCCSRAVLQEIAHFEVASPAVGINWSPDGNLLAVSGQSGVVLFDESFGIVNRLPFEEGDPPAVTTVWGHDQEIAATLALDGTVYLWNTVNGAILDTWQSHTVTTTTIDWSLDGNRIATASWDGTVALYDPQNKTVISNSLSRKLFFTVSSLSWHPDSRHLAITGIDERNAVYVWDNYLDQLVYQLDDNFAYLVKWSPDGGILAIGSLISQETGDFRDLGAIRMWQPEQEIELTMIPNNIDDNIILSIQWHPENQLIASLSLDGQVTIWDRLTGEAIAETAIGPRQSPADLPSHDALAWDPGGKLLAGVDTDGNVSIWQFEISSHTCTNHPAIYHNNIFAVSAVAETNASSAIACASCARATNIS